MNLRIGVCLLSGLAVSAALQAQTAKSTFALDKSVEVPGSTLKAGTYTIAVLDSLSDRTVLSLDGDDGKKHLLLLGVRNTPLNGTVGQPVLWDTKTQGKHALRGFVFPGGKSVELVYPKADAAALANANHQSVVAVDTASEGRPELTKLSSRDMQLVNLWLLTPTRVGPDKGLEAKRFTPSSTTQVAQTGAGPITTQPAAYTGQQTAATPSTGAGVQLARADAPPSIRPRATTTGRKVSRLPQTGSNLPFFYLTSATALLAAALLRVRRDRAASAA